MKPRLSVIVPFFQVEAYIGDCLGSLARQSFTDFEACSSTTARPTKLGGG